MSSLFDDEQPPDQRHAPVTDRRARSRTPGRRSPENEAVSAFLGEFQRLYTRYLGATYFIRRPVDPMNVKRLLQVYPPDRLRKLAVILLTTDEPWIASTDRGIGILTVKASWLDGLLARSERREVV